MMRHLLAVSLALLLVAAPALADGVGHYTEAFDSPDYVGSATTAYWNTSGGELTLHALTLDAVGWYEIGVSTVVADLAVSGNRAYAATSAGLHILDISSPTSVAWLGVYAPGNSFTAVDVDGRHVFLGEGSNSIRVVDVSDPTSPTLIGLTAATSIVHDLVVSGNTLYAACGSAGVRSYSVKTLPGAPFYQDTFSTSDAVGVAVDGDELYVADATDGLVAINITDPLIQSSLAVGGVGGQARAVAVRGTLAYVVCSGGTDLLQVVDVRELNATAALGALAHGGATGLALTVTGDYAYVANGVNGMIVVDISDKGAPEELAALSSPAVDVVGIHVAGEYAFLADDTGLRVIDVADPVLPPFPVAQLAGDGNPGRITVNGDHAYVCDANGGLLRVVDISNPVSPQLLNSVWTHGDALDIEIAGNYAFVADGKPGLSTLDVSNPSGPRTGGFIRPQMNVDPPGEVTDVVVVGELAFVSVASADASHGNGYCVVNLADPEYPVVLETEPGCNLNPNGRYAHGIDVVGDRIYIANGGAGLQVVDRVAGCSSAELIGVGGEARAVEVSGDYAYVATGEAGLVIVNVSRFGDPVLALELESTLDTPGTARGVAVNGNTVYLADDTGGLCVIDVTDPAAPAEVVAAHQPTSGAVCGLAIDGDYLYSANHSEGLVVYRITTPDDPQEVGTYDVDYWSSFGNAYVDVAVSDDVAYITDDLSGLHVVNVSTPSNPSSFAAEGSSACRLPGSAEAVALYGEYALVADGEFGLDVIDVSVDAQPRALFCLDTQGGSRSVCVHGDDVYFSDHGPLWSETGLISVDGSDPTRPSYAGCTAMVEGYFDVSVGDIAAAGDLAYLSDHWSNLLTVDVSEPTDPFRADADTLSNVTHTNNARDVALDGDYLYVASSWYGLQAVDVADDDTLAIRCGEIDEPGSEPMGVAVSGDYCFIADSNLGLRVVDVANPRGLDVNDVLDGYQTPSAWDVAVDGDYAYVADHDSGLWVFSVFSREADPERCLAQSIPVDEDTLGIARARLNATCSGNSIAWELGLSNTSDAWQPLVPGADVVFAEADTGLRWRATLHPVEIGVVPSCQDLTLDWWYDCALIDTVVDIPEDQGRWTRVSFTRSGYDFEDDASPVTMYGVWRRVDDRAVLSRVQVEAVGKYVGRRSWTSIEGVPDVPDLGSGCRIVHVDGRAFAVSDGSGASPFARDTVWEYVAYVPAMQQETYTVAVPTHEDGEPHGQNPNINIFLEFDLTGTNEITLPAFTTFTARIYLENFEPGGGTEGLPFALEHAFDGAVTSYTNLLPGGVPPLGDPESGWWLGSSECATPDVNGRLEVATVDYICFSTTSGTIEIIPNPQPDGGQGVLDCALGEDDWCVRLSPSGHGGVGGAAVPAGDCPATDPRPWTVYCVSAHRADPALWYVSPPDSGYSVDDLAPAKVLGLRIPSSQTLTWDAGQDLDLDHYTVYGCTQGGHTADAEKLLDIEETTCSLPDSTVGRYVFVTATDLSGNESEPSDLLWNSGTAIPDRKFLAQNVPNPFNPVTTIRFGLPAEAKVSIEVYDVAGRVVSVVADGPYQPGEHEVLWDGRDGAGHKVAAGVYFYSMTSGEFEARRRMVLLK